VIALLATSVAWFLPSQTPSYLVAQSASERRLFSHAQAQRFALAYTVLTLIGLRALRALLALARPDLTQSCR